MERGLCNFCFKIKLNVPLSMLFANCFMRKVGQGQRLCNCMNSPILEGYIGQGMDVKGFVKLF